MIRGDNEYWVVSTKWTHHLTEMAKMRALARPWDYLRPDWRRRLRNHRVFAEHFAKMIRGADDRAG